MDNNIKLEFYNILNGISMNYLKKKSPFNIINDIKLTYDKIDIKYLKGKNYFIKVDKNKSFNKDHHNKGFKEHKNFDNKGFMKHKNFDNKDHHNKDHHNKGFNKNFDNKRGGLSAIMVYC